MTPPDTNMQKQQRRHWGSLAGIGLVVLIAVGAILLWLADDVTSAAGSEAAQESVSSEDIREGDVEAPDNLPVEEVEPGDPGTILETVE